MPKKPADDQLFLFIGGKAFTIKELGPAADQRIDKALQSILDQGLLGEEYVGLAWHEVFKSSNLKLESAPSPDETLQYVLYQRYQESLDHCKQMSVLGTLTQEHKDAMLQLRRDWQAATKLAGD